MLVMKDLSLSRFLPVRVGADMVVMKRFWMVWCPLGERGSGAEWRVGALYVYTYNSQRWNRNGLERNQEFVRRDKGCFGVNPNRALIIAGPFMVMHDGLHVMPTGCASGSKQASCECSGLIGVSGWNSYHPDSRGFPL